MRRRQRARRRPPRPPRARWDSTSTGCSSRRSTSDSTSRAYRSLDIDAGSVVDDAARVSLADLLVGLAMFAVVGAAASPALAPAAVRSVEVALATRPDYSVVGSTVETVLTTRVRLRNR